jgi:hypothetical protein
VLATSLTPKQASSASRPRLPQRNATSHADHRDHGCPSAGAMHHSRRRQQPHRLIASGASRDSDGSQHDAASPAPPGLLQPGQPQPRGRPTPRGCSSASAATLSWPSLRMRKVAEAAARVARGDDESDRGWAGMRTQQVAPSAWIRAHARRRGAMMRAIARPRRRHGPYGLRFEDRRTQNGSQIFGPALRGRARWS